MTAKILHIILAGTVLFSSVGVVFNQHFCGGELKNFAFFAAAQNCHSDAVNACPFHQKQQKKQKKDCCRDKTQLFKDAQEQAQSSVDFNLFGPVLSAGVLPSVLLLHNNFAEQKVLRFLAYQPPDPPSDRVILYDNFLL